MRGLLADLRPDRVAVYGYAHLPQLFKPQRQINDLAAELGWHGPIIVISNACASGANAIGWGVEMIRSGCATRTRSSLVRWQSCANV